MESVGDHKMHALLQLYTRYSAGNSLDIKHIRRQLGINNEAIAENKVKLF